LILKTILSIPYANVISATYVLYIDPVYCYNLSLDTTDEEARRQFLEEIELMKAIGSHKNIVSMLGCWVHSDPIFLMLEYVPYGDLQHWLRNKRIQVDFTLIRG